MHLNLMNEEESKLKTVTQPGCGQGQRYIKTTSRFLKCFGDPPLSDAPLWAPGGHHSPFAAETPKAQQAASQKASS